MSYTQCGVLLSWRKDALAICGNMNGPRGNNAKQNKFKGETQNFTVKCNTEKEKQGSDRTKPITNTRSLTV